MNTVRLAIVVGCLILIGCGGGESDVSGSLDELRVRSAEAFYETFYGVADRREEAIEVALAVRRLDSEDVSSYWWPAAMRMLGAFRGWRTWKDFEETPPAVRADVELAKEETAEAVRLADEQGVTLPIMTTWPGMTTFLDGQLRGDATDEATGVELMREEARVRPTLGNLMFVEIVGQAVEIGGPLLTESVEHARRALEMGALEGCLVNRDACGNSHVAPHNIEGGMLIFADVHLKAGDLETAQQVYTLIRNLGAESGWPYLSVVEERLASLEDRAALYRNGDRGDDPLFGVAGSLCEGCHYN